jgi:hypothetical protein
VAEVEDADVLLQVLARDEVVVEHVQRVEQAHVDHDRVRPAVLDLVTAQSSYNSVEYLMPYLCAVEMAKWLDLPNWGYAGTSDSQCLDLAGMEGTRSPSSPCRRVQPS